MFVFPVMVQCDGRWPRHTRYLTTPWTVCLFFFSRCCPVLVRDVFNCLYPTPGHAHMLLTHLTGVFLYLCWVTWLFPQHSAPPLLLLSICPSTLWTSTTSSVGILDPELLQGRSTSSTRSLSKDRCPSGDSRSHCFLFVHTVCCCVSWLPNCPYTDFYWVV